MTNRGNEPAFPKIAHQYFNGQSVTWADGTAGMTIREYFAGLALQRCFLLESMTNSDVHRHETSYEILAEMSVKFADALIEELSKPINP